MNENASSNATTNAILVILLVLVVGFVVWFVTIRENTPAVEDGQSPALQLNIGDNDSDANAPGAENQ